MDDKGGIAAAAAAHTSSLLVCFCLLALMVEPPASLCTVELACVSKLGRGILDAGLLLKAGMVLVFAAPPLGVPLVVPLEAIATRY